ncbi:unnamed protein product [Sphagnum balticum]
MFTVNNSGLPTTADQYFASQTSASIAVFEPSTSLTGTPSIANLFSNTITVQTSVTQTSSTVFTATIPSTVNTVNSSPLIIVTPIGTFTPAVDPTNPQPGEFVIVVNEVSLISNQTVTAITLVFPQQSNTLFASGVSGLDGLNVFGNINITDNFEDHPSATMNLAAKQKDLSNLRSRFQNGAIVNLCGFALIVQSYQEQIDNFSDAAFVTISLRGRWIIPINLPVPLLVSPTPSSTGYQDPSCAVNATTNSSTPTEVSIQVLASRVQASIAGITFNVTIPQSNTSANTTTTLMNELTKYKDIKSSFFDFTYPSAIRFKNINAVASWSFTENQLLSPFQTTVNRLPTVAVSAGASFPIQINTEGSIPSTITIPNWSVNGENTALYPLPTIANNVTADNFNASGQIQTPPEATQQQNPPQYQFRNPVRNQYYLNDLDDAATMPSNITKITTLDLNFDQSGVTKTQVYRTDEDGFPVQDITQKYGFAYTAADITQFIVQPGDTVASPVLLCDTPANFWTLNRTDNERLPVR